MTVWAFFSKRGATEREREEPSDRATQQNPKRLTATARACECERREEGREADDRRAEMATEVAVVKQLDFTSEDGPPELVPVQPASFALKSELENVKENPSNESFQEAFSKIVELTEERIERIRKCASNAAAGGTGDGALRSMRDQFRSLKGSYISLDTKEAFIDALMAGRPDGTESSLLTQAQSATSQSADELRKCKKQKEKVSDEIRELIEKLCAEYENFEDLKAKVAASLAKLNEAMAAYDESFEEYTALSNKASKFPKDKLRQSIAEAKALEAEKVQRKARQETEIQEADAEIQALRERIAAARSELKQVQSAAAESNKTEEEQTTVEARLLSHETFLKDTIAAITEVSGISINRVTETDLELCIKTEPDSGAFASNKLSGCTRSLEEDLETAEHEVTIGISQETQCIDTATMVPSDCPFADVLGDFWGSDCVPAFVHAVIARVGACKVRQAYLKNADLAAMGVEAQGGEDAANRAETILSKRYASGRTIQIAMPCSWPQDGAKLALRECSEDLKEDFSKSGAAEGSLKAAIDYLDAKLNV